MIYFKRVRWKNFLSTGDQYTEVQLDRSPTTLIVGQNGAGKSTMLDALSFALFGKPHRNINKPQLINTINNKNCCVEVEFTVGKIEFKVVRGIKPGKFEIYVNGKMANQESNARDYQKYLEQNILKLNHKSFHQIVVLGSSSFIPFMQLPAQHRRDVIEDLLDINIFSKMNQLTKEKNQKIKEQLKDTNYQLDLTKDKIGVQSKYLKDITQLNEETIRGKQNEITEIQKEISSLQEENSRFSEQIQDAKPKAEEKLAKLQKKRDEINGYQVLFKQKIKDVVADAKFYDENENCPTCSQAISESIKEEKIKASRSKSKELQQAMDDVTEKQTDLESNIKTINDELSAINETNSALYNNNTTIARLQRQISNIENDILDLEGKDGDASSAKQLLEELRDEKESLAERKLTLVDDRTYYEAALEMLKDTGIKTKIVREYLPVMNNLINKYLQVLDFFVSFHLDEEFNETIKSRHRDSFNYASFSEGEKQRIDLALLFTWRQIAKMKNSTSTNLLVLDETFDSSLDHDGVENLQKILGTLEDDANVFVISHKGDLLDGKFRSKIEFVKEHNFSVMKTS